MKNLFAWMDTDYYKKLEQERYLELAAELAAARAAARKAQMMADKYAECCRQAEILYADLSERVHKLEAQLKQFR